MTFGKWAEKQRKLYSYTYEDLANKTGLSKSAVHDVCKKDVDARYSTMKVIANAFNLDLWRVIKSIDSED